MNEWMDIFLFRLSKFLIWVIYFSLQIVINAALGFDTFLVVRHGVQRPVAMETDDASSTPRVPLEGAIRGENLGCYFCNDVVAPGNVRTIYIINFLMGFKRYGTLAGILMTIYMHICTELSPMFLELN